MSIVPEKTDGMEFRTLSPRFRTVLINPRIRIWTHPFSQVISYVKSEVFAYVYPAINERLIVRSGPDDIRTLSPYRAIGYSQYTLRVRYLQSRFYHFHINCSLQNWGKFFISTVVH
jgi:hypothetical protein